MNALRFVGAKLCAIFAGMIGFAVPWFIMTNNPLESIAQENILVSMMACIGVVILVDAAFTRSQIHPKAELQDRQVQQQPIMRSPLPPAQASTIPMFIGCKKCKKGFSRDEIWFDEVAFPDFDGKNIAFTKKIPRCPKCGAALSSFDFSLPESNKNQKAPILPKADILEGFDRNPYEALQQTPTAEAADPPKAEVTPDPIQVILPKPSLAADATSVPSQLPARRVTKADGSVIEYFADGSKVEYLNSQAAKA